MAGIFIVDDDEYIRELFSLELSERGHEVATAGSGRQVIKKIASARPDVLIADYFITKSCELTELKTMIDRALEQGVPFSRNGYSLSYSKSARD